MQIVILITKAGEQEKMSHFLIYETNSVYLLFMKNSKSYSSAGWILKLAETRFMGINHSVNLNNTRVRAKQSCLIVPV